MKNFFLAIAFLSLIIIPNGRVNAQGGVAVNTSGAAPDASAYFDVSGTNKGVLIPRLTTVERNAIVNPAKGLFIYNTDCDVVNYNAGTPASPNWATMAASNVLAAGVSIVASPAGAICAGTSVTFSATPSQNNLSPSYQWQVNGSNEGTNSTTYTTSSLNNGDVVTCILTSSAQCVTGSPATSNAITMLTNLVPAITGTTPAGFCSGSAVTLSASANIGTINWYNVSTGGSSLSTGASFTVSGLTSTTTYYVDATANGCTSSSRTAVAATFYPNAPGQPGAISGPNTVNKSDTDTYSISALSNTSSYFWTVSMGTITGGQGTNSISVMWGDSSGAGSVSVVANNPCGTGSSQSLNVSISTETFTYTGSPQSFTVPANVTSLVIEAWGAQGANGNNSTGGYGADMKGTFTVTPGEVLTLVVGQQAPNNIINGGGGGGSSGVKDPSSTILIVAGGGGGGGNNMTNHGISDAVTGTSGQNTYGCGGGTLLGYGGTGGNGGETGSVPCGGDWPQGGGGAGVNSNGDSPFLYNNGNCTGGYSSGAGGGAGINAGNPGGYGFTGGGGTSYAGGGGGGYSGGAGGSSADGYITGGGGGSYNTGTNQTNTGGVQTGNGQIVISW